MADLHTRLGKINERLEELPKGTLTYKKINGKEQPYLQWSENGRSRSVYIKGSERDKILMEIEERNRLLEERTRLRAYFEHIGEILSRNPYLDREMSRGYQDFSYFIEKGFFYVDKTQFIREWWEQNDQITLITRPRRFGKTLMLSAIDNFFSPQRKRNKEYFEKLKVWKSEELRHLYGTIPVIFISFAGVKGKDFKGAISAIELEVRETYHSCKELEYDDSILKEPDQLAGSIRLLSEAVCNYYGATPIILLDEYDTPLTEAYLSGYWDEMIIWYRRFISETFKKNRNCRKALITGVTKITKNSLFSDMNNIVAYSCTDNRYADCFGFTEEEVRDALDCYDIQEMEKVKTYYDGFSVGMTKDLYNPWSICNYMVDRSFCTYWINTAGNDLIGDLIRKHSARLKKDMQTLMQGNCIRKRINENIAFQYMDGDEEAFWSLLLATGYISADHVVKELEYTECDIRITNLETMTMFRAQVMRMFSEGQQYYNDFEEALLKHRNEELNAYINDIAFTSMSYFDSGRRPSEKAPENFYHGLVLGLIVSLRDRYHITSNRESGFGRYDIAMIPFDKEQDAFLIEFKVRNEKKEASLSETAANALKQIEEKQYEAELLAQGIPAERIYKLGFAFEGKEVLVIEE